MTNRFIRLEERIKALVEGSFARLFAGHLHPRRVALRLARAMGENARPGPRPIAPDHYTVFLHPEDHAALLRAQPDLAQALGSHLVDLAARLDMTMPQFPTVVFSPDPSGARQEVRVEAAHTPGIVSTTHEMDPLSPAEMPPPGARLVVEGRRTVPLVEGVVNIGRRMDNHIVLDDTRVSRRHAQLQVRQGRYVLFDLGSRRGTEVNGQTVETCILRTGDQVSFGGVVAQYHEDPPARQHQDTHLYTP